MTINQQQDTPEGGSADLNQAPVLSPQGAARRRFTRAGIGATGVLATLVSQPGMAQTVCAAPSGSLSTGMAASNQPDPAPSCSGVSPGAYMQNATWPAGVDKKSRFDTIFTCPSRCKKIAETALEDVFKLKDNDDPHNLGAHLLACYLNAVLGTSTVLTIPMIKNIWDEFQATGGGKVGYYTVTAGVKWYGKDITDYLRTTYHQAPPVPKLK